MSRTGAASADIVSFDAERASRYLLSTMMGFIGDPPDSEFQRGYLACLVTTYCEGLGKGAGDDRIEMLDALWKRGPA